MELNLTDIKGHLSAILGMYEELNDRIFEDEHSGRWIHFILQRELKGVLNDLDKVKSIE